MPIFASTCPPVRKNVKCEYVKHQCWSLGVPDLDCPGNGLCCFNGCNYMCQPTKTILAGSKETLHIKLTLTDGVIRNTFNLGSTLSVL